MTSPSELNRRRSKNSGFTLLEVMLAFAALAMVLVGLYSFSAGALRRESDALFSYERASMARALIDEYVATYPLMPSSGTYKKTWEWHITEEPTEGLRETSLDEYFAFVRITAHVRDLRDADPTPQTLSTVVARRGIKP